MAQNSACKVHEILKTARENKRIAIHSVRKETRISLAFLEAMESGRWNEFPAEVYLLGFLRKYAAYLRLNPEEIVAQYKQEMEAVHSSQNAVAAKEVEVKKKEETLSLIKLIALFFLVVLLGVWWVASILRAPQGSGAEATAAAKQKSEAPQAENLAILKLSIEALDTVWIRVLADEKLLFEGFFNKGSLKSFEAQKEFSVRLGNVNSVRLSLNNRAVDPRPGAQLSVNELVLDRQSLSHEFMNDENPSSIVAPSTAVKANSINKIFPEPIREKRN